MNFANWLAAFVTLMVIPASASAEATAPPEIEIAFPEAPGVIFTNSQGQPDGPLLHRLGTALAELGISWHAVSYPAARLYENMQSGVSNFSILNRSKLLDDCCLYSKDPVRRGDIGLYHIGDRPPVKGRQDLAGKTVITIRGYTYGSLLAYITDGKNGITDEMASSHDAAFEMLLAGRGEYVIDYPTNVTALLASHPIPDLRFEAIDHIEMYLVLAKAYPDAERTMARIEANYKGLGEDEISQPASKSKP